MLDNNYEYPAKDVKEFLVPKSLAPGKYAVTASYEHAKGHPEDRPCPYWHGKVTTGAVEIEIKPNGAAAKGGDAVGGLCLRLEAAKAEYRQGEPLDLRVFLDNVADKPLVVLKRTTHVDMGIEAYDAQRQFIVSLLPPAPPPRLAAGDLAPLAAGASLELKGWEMLVRVNREIQAGHGRTGRFTIRASYRAQAGGDFWNVRKLDPAAWVGALQSNAVELEIKPRAADDQGGEAAGGLRLALKMSKDRYAVGERWDGTLRVEAVEDPVVLDRAGATLDVHLERVGGGDAGQSRRIGSGDRPAKTAADFVALDKDNKTGLVFLELRAFARPGPALAAPPAVYLETNNGSWGWNPPAGTYRIWFTCAKKDDDGAKYGVAGKVWTGELKSNVVTVAVGDAKGAAASPLTEQQALELAARLANEKAKEKGYKFTFTAAECKVRKKDNDGWTILGGRGTAGKEALIKMGPGGENPEVTVTWSSD